MNQFAIVLTVNLLLHDKRIKTFDGSPLGLATVILRPIFTVILRINLRNDTIFTVKNQRQFTILNLTSTSRSLIG